MYMPQPGEGELIIGVSIQLPEVTSRLVQERRSHLGDPLAYKIPPHITLLGPTVVREADLPQIRAGLREIGKARPSFKVRLLGTGTFLPVSPVVFLKLVEGADHCQILERLVRHTVTEANPRFEYHPHVTLAHEVSAGALEQGLETMAEFDRSFTVNGIRLYIAGDDGVWRPVRKFNLTG